MGKDQKPTSDIVPETDFWQKLVSSGMTDFEVRTLGEQNQQGLHVVSLSVSMKTKTADGPRSRYVMEQQAWQQQGDQWRIVVATHSDVVKMPPALKPNPNLYNKNADAKLEIEEAVAKAKKDHQRVILVFGGNWCYDCHVLDQAFHQSDVAPLLENNFQVVHVDIGDDGKKTMIWRRNTRFHPKKVSRLWQFSARMVSCCIRRRMASGSQLGRLILTT
jgi:thioredoxin-related protein